MENKKFSRLTIPKLFLINTSIILLILEISFDFWLSLTLSILIAAFFMYLRDIVVLLEEIKENERRKDNPL